MKKQILILVLILSTTTIIAENPFAVKLAQGQNNITIEEYFPSIFVSELIREYPKIQSISTIEYGQTYGYLNTMGGIGTNFIFQSSQTYEIYTTENITIYLIN